MLEITTTKALSEFCNACTTQDFVTVDTEFLREKTYYSKLCLIQIAYDGDGKNDAALVDVLADGLDLAPLYALFDDESVIKVFHAARQDLEIFFHESGRLPTPFFDTQVAAMVCGFGEQVGYERLVRAICDAELDKSSRFTDWSNRPLSDKQKRYAVGDVTYLRDIYKDLSKRLTESKRTGWVGEELEVLLDPATYNIDPADAWKRVKMRSSSKRMLAAVMELAAFREHHAQTHNIPRNRVFKDDALLEMAATRPKSSNDFKNMRLIQRDVRKNSDIADGILKALKAADSRDPKTLPKHPKRNDRPQGVEGLAELLRVFLKARAEEYKVATKLIASSSDLDMIASGDYSGPMFKGWRADVFGDDAKRLCKGELALSSNGKSVITVPL
ncbi:MAG: ribonuclease D [Pseudomonadota bacterium]